MGFLGQAVRPLALLGILLLVSCIDGREEYWLNADGSGRADITYNLPAAAATFEGGEEGVEKKLGEFLTGIPAIKTSHLAVTTRGDRLTIHLQATFDSALELARIRKDGSLEKLPSSATGLSGIIDVSLSGRTVAVSRVIEADKSLPGSAFMPDSRFEGRNLNYIIHLPLPATESNAGKINNGGRTLEWNFPMSRAIQGPLTLRFKAPVPIPTWAWAAVILTLITSGFLIVIAIRNLKRKKRQAIGHAA